MQWCIECDDDFKHARKKLLFKHSFFYVASAKYVLFTAYRFNCLHNDYERNVKKTRGEGSTVLHYHWLVAKISQSIYKSKYFVSVSYVKRINVC